MSKENIHEGHRKRVKERFINSGSLDNFADHQVLELLLFYCYARSDTNEIAHKLIKQYGSLSNLFEAHPLDIKERCGVSLNVAVLISMIPSLARRYFSCRWKKRSLISSSKDGANIAMSLLAGRIIESFFIICLDNQDQLIYCELATEGTVNRAPIYVRELISIALKHKASKIILAHNHPSGVIEPSDSDVTSTKIIVKAMAYVDIQVLDHIIVAGDKYFSFSENGILPLPN